MSVSRPRICVHCPNCDMVRVPPAAVTLRHCVDTDAWDYWVRCPVCGERSAGASNWWLAVEAFAAGSNLEQWRLPAELREQHGGRPLDLLDLAALRLALADPDWLDALTRAPGTDERKPPG